MAVVKDEFARGKMVMLVKEDCWSKKNEMVIGESYKVELNLSETVSLVDREWHLNKSQLEPIGDTKSLIPKFQTLDHGIENLSELPICMQSAIIEIENGNLPTSCELKYLHQQDPEYVCISNLDDDFLFKMKQDALEIENDSSYNRKFRALSSFIVSTIQWYLNDK